MIEGSKIFLSRKYSIQSNRIFTICLPDYAIFPLSLHVRFHDDDVNRVMAEGYLPNINEIVFVNTIGGLKKDVVFEDNHLRILISTTDDQQNIKKRYRETHYIINPHHETLGPRINSFNFHVTPYIKLSIDLSNILFVLAMKKGALFDDIDMPFVIQGIIEEFIGEEEYDITIIVQYRKIDVLR